MSEHLKSISKDGLTPLFQYALGQYGTIEQDEDDLGDFTTFNEFKPSIKESATYVQIDNLITNRTESGLSAKLYNVNEVYLSKKVVSDQVRTIGELSVLLEDNAEITRINPSLLVKLKATGGKIYILAAKKKSKLTTVEKAELDDNDSRIDSCTDSILKQVKMDAENCVMVPYFSVGAPRTLKIDEDSKDGQTIATASFVSTSEAKDSKFLKVDLRETVQSDTIGGNLNLNDVVLVNKEKQMDLEGTYTFMFQ